MTGSNDEPGLLDPERSRPGQALEVCPVCGGEVRSVQCKRVCARCRSLVENCSGD